MERGQEGFSLIEVLVVVAILGVLAGVMVLAIGEFVERSRIQVCRFEEGVLVGALESARADNDRSEYPPVAGIDGLDGLRLAGFLRWEPKSTYWVYTSAAASDGSLTTELVRAGTDTVPVADCN